MNIPPLTPAAQNALANACREGAMLSLAMMLYIGVQEDDDELIERSLVSMKAYFEKHGFAPLVNKVRQLVILERN